MPGAERIRRFDRIHGRTAGETCPLLLAVLGGEPSDPATLRGHGRADRVSALAYGIKSATGRGTWGSKQGDGEVSKKSREEQVNVPVGSIRKARRLLRASGLPKCARKRASWVYARPCPDAKTEILAKRRFLMKHFFTLLLTVLLGAICVCNKSEAQSSEPGTAASMDRTVLPIPEPKYPPITELDASKATAPPRFEVKAPKGAPNVVIILLDNFGFGDPDTFGGPIQMPTLGPARPNRAALQQFQGAPLCSPSRMALLTGRNSHSANFGVISEIATAFPGYTAMRPRTSRCCPRSCGSTAIARPCSASVMSWGPGNPALSDRSTAGRCMRV